MHRILHTRYPGIVKHLHHV